METLILVFSAIFGLIFGSFLNVCIYRIPREKSIAWPPSACPKCNAHIKWYDNIPVFSFLWLRGKCRNCKQPISVQYPLVERLTGVLTFLFVWRYGLTPWTFVVLAAVYALVILSVIDLELMIIPDRFSLGLIGLGLAFAWLNPNFEGIWWQKELAALLGAGVGLLACWRLRLSVLGGLKKKQWAAATLN